MSRAAAFKTSIAFKIIRIRFQCLEGFIYKFIGTAQWDHLFNFTIFFNDAIAHIICSSFIYKMVAIYAYFVYLHNIKVLMLRLLFLFIGS